MATHHAERMIEANGIELCADAFGDPSDPAILLFSGGSASMLLWEEDFCERLADGGRFVIRHDQRDTGKTTSCPPGEPNYTLNDMAADGVAVLDAYEVERAHIAGLSMGGFITQLAALDYPERVLTLTQMMSTPDLHAFLAPLMGNPEGAKLPPPRPQVMEAFTAVGEIDGNDPDAVLASRVRLFQSLQGSKYRGQGRSEALLRAEIDRAISFQSSMNHVGAELQTEPWVHRLSELDLPTLVIHGDEDPIVPFEHGEAVQAAIRGSTLLRMAGVGHELPRGVWDVVVPAILEHTS